MKAEELMVGDWVYCTYPSINKYLRVAEIKTVADDELKVVLFDNVRLVFSVKYIKSIPITPEILEKNGFAEKNVFADSLGFEIFGNKSLSCGLSYVENEGFLFETYKPWTKTADDGSPEDWAYISQDKIRGIQYVHELQHALRLCGIEKEIEL